MLAFRAPDLRGIVAYSSMAQMGLIVLGVFALNDLGIDGAVLQSVAHALVSATMFLVGMVERRCGTGSSTRSAAWRGRPLLATVLIATGIIALAVPGSATFAGEFLIMAGVYGEGWGCAAIVALGIVLAAMYTLRLISAVLHVRPGRAVRDEALDLRPGELALVLPLVACLLALSAWPALVSELVPGRPAGAGHRRGLPVIDTASTGSRSRRRSRCSARQASRCSSPSSSPPGCGSGTSATVAFAGFVVAAVAGLVFDDSSTPEALIDESMTRDRSPR